MWRMKYIESLLPINWGLIPGLENSTKFVIFDVTIVFINFIVATSSQKEIVLQNGIVENVG